MNYGGLVTAIKEGTTTVDETFPKLKQPNQQKKVDKIEAAMMESEATKKQELF